MDDVLKQSVITQNVTLAVGNTLTLKLGSNYTTPYRWTPDTKIGDDTIVKQTGHRFVQPTTDALGAPGTEVWTFTALKPGTTTITTYYTSFVGHDAAPKCAYNATVTVQ
jgi:inhibitor of cysteine peptidase